jgi:hypothetical protein
MEVAAVNFIPEPYNAPDADTTFADIKQTHDLLAANQGVKMHLLIRVNTIVNSLVGKIDEPNMDWVRPLLYYAATVFNHYMPGGQISNTRNALMERRAQLVGLHGALSQDQTDSIVQFYDELLNAQSQPVQLGGVRHKNKRNRGRRHPTKKVKAHRRRTSRLRR